MNVEHQSAIFAHDSVGGAILSRYHVDMSHAEILAELPKLSQEQRQEILNRLCDLQDRDVMAGRGPTEDLKRLLDNELADYERTGDGGTPWEEFVSDLRAGNGK